MNNYSLEIECPGNGATQGVGYSLGFSSPHQIDTSSISNLSEWISQLSRTVESIGDSVFDAEDAINKTAAEILIRKICEINCKYDYIVESIDQVPAIQIDSVEGRRVELDIDHKRHEGFVKSFSIITNEHDQKVENIAVRGVSPHGKHLYRFKKNPVFFSNWEEREIGSHMETWSDKTMRKPHGTRQV